MSGSRCSSTARPSADTLHERCAQPPEQIGEINVVVAALGQQFVHRGNREDAVHGIFECLLRVDHAVGARLESQQRRNGLKVVLDAVVDLLGEHAPHYRAAVLERNGCLLRNRREQVTVVLGEGRSPVDDELPDLTAAPAQRLADRVRVRTPLGPGNLAVLEYERGAGRRERIHRRRHDRFE